jgi:hypothetical protein
MSDRASAAAPDPKPVLDGLRDFQRGTVNYVFDRLYGSDEPTRRFLVADEVGLGKTMVARGVVARAVDALWDRLEEIKRIDVIYICSNLEIARQNVNRLRLDRETRFAEPTRMTLLPRTLHNLRKQRLNFVSLTPGTSFDPRSSLGIVEERALLYLLLEEEWELRGSAPKNVLAGNSGRGSFDEWVDSLRREDDIDRELAESFRERIRSGPGVELHRRWEELLPAFGRAGRRSNRPEEAKREQLEIVGDLRRLLAETCVQALEPDLIILDEFQRFRDLLHFDPKTGARSEAGELANVLFGYPDARVLLLSATPYKPYTRAWEEDGDHYRDFVDTVGFLLDSDARTAKLEALLGEMRAELLSWRDDSVERLADLKGRVEGLLSRVMCRTERLGASANRDGMLVEVDPVALDTEPADLEAYVRTANVADTLEEPDQLELWKSAPYLLNLMDGYKLKNRLREAVGDDGDPAERKEVGVALAAAAESLLPFDVLRSFGEIEPQNARLRALAADTVDQGSWRILWMPPSLPYYEPVGPFAEPQLRAMTKRLVFSAWTVVPKAIATLLSYEAERRMTLCGNSEAANSAAARNLRGGLLDFKRSSGRLSGLPVLALLYPSFALAEGVNLAEFAAAVEGDESGLSHDEMVRRAAEALRPALERVTGSTPSGGRVDERWYWAAPLLLDVDRDRAGALAWLEDDELVARWSGGDPDASQSDSGWRDHIEAAVEVARNGGDLKRPPADLLEVLAQFAVAGPGVVALRALAGATSEASATRDPEVRIAAGVVAWSLRSLFNLPESTDLIRGLGDSRLAYWRLVLHYCVDGCLQAVLDEYVHVLRESQGLIGDLSASEVAKDLAGVMTTSVSVRTTSTGADEIRFSGDGPELVSEHKMRMRFAMRFGDQQGEGDEHLQRAENVRQAFNSPFWPFVLASTSVGQEGLDFHPYCHAVVHWNLPSNPVDLEQREGRVHRYKGHAVRRNLAATHGADVLADGADDVWSALFDAGIKARPKNSTDLEPFWITPGDAQIERHVLAQPLSRDAQRLVALKRSLTLYRMVFGQARQGDLVDYLATRVPPADLERLTEALRIDLTPR